MFFSFFLKDERQDVQKKTFTKWINVQLSKVACSPIDDLFQELRDGHKLLSLLEVLTSKKYVSNPVARYVNAIQSAVNLANKNNKKKIVFFSKFCFLCNYFRNVKRVECVCITSIM